MVGCLPRKLAFVIRDIGSTWNTNRSVHLFIIDLNMEEIASESNSSRRLYKRASNVSSRSLGFPPTAKSDEVTAELEAASLRLFYIENLVHWLNSFEDLVAKKLITSLAVLISPVVSSKIGIIETEVTKSFGYIEGLCLILRQCFDHYNFNFYTSIKTQPIDRELHQLLNKIEELCKNLHSKATKVDPTLQKMLHSISRFKRKLPYNLSFLDSEIKELAVKSDATGISLAIWKSWINEPCIEDGPYNLEVQWDSSSHKEVVIHDLYLTKEFPNSTQSSNVQANLIRQLLILISNRLEESLNNLSSIEADVKTSKYILKKAYLRIHEDEQDCTISPSTFYVIIRYFENYINISVTCFKEISNNISIIKTLVSVGRKSLEEKSVIAPMFQYPKDTHIVVSFEAEETFVNSLSSEEELSKKDYLIISQQMLPKFKLPEVGSRMSLMTVWINDAISKLTISRKPSSVDDSSVVVSIRDSCWTWDKGKSILKGNFAKSSSPNTMSSEERFLRSSMLPTLDEKVTSILTGTLDMLKKPNASLNEGEEIENISGLAMLLAATVMNLNFYKEVSASQRLNLEEAFQQVDCHLKKLTNPPLHGDITSSLSKVKTLIKSLDRSLSHAFGLEDDDDDDDETFQRALSQVETTTPSPSSSSHQLNEDVHSFSDNIADHIAAKNGDHLWQAVCGTDAEGYEGGIIFKNPTSHDAHTYARLSVFKRVEVIISLLKFIDDIVSVCENNAIAVLAQLSQVRTNVKSTIRGLKKSIKNGDVTRLNVDKIQVPLRRYEDACQKIFLLCEDIFILLDFVAHVVKDLRLYVSLSFKVFKMSTNKSAGVASVTIINRKQSQSPMQMYRKLMEQNLMEIELGCKKLIETPVSVVLPLRFTGVSDEPHLM